ncbi:MAG: OB-fold putative lipoprotein [Gemmataceae bacterium]|nr:OB-fold putative lipoprotein [Gemmataceae bacterium]
MARVVVLGCIFALLAGRSGADDVTKIPSVTVSELIETFLTNEAYADEFYVGRQIEVSGKVVRISRSKYGSSETEGGDYVLELDRFSNRGLTVLLFFGSAERKQLAQVKPGQNVTLRGTCRQRAIWAEDARTGGYETSQVRVVACKLVRAEKGK